MKGSVGVSLCMLAGAGGVLAGTMVARSGTSQRARPSASALERESCAPADGGRLAELEGRLTALERLRATDAAPPARAPVPDLDATIRSWMERHAPHVLADHAARAALPVERGSAWTELLDPALSTARRAELLRELERDGRLQEAIDGLAALAAASPDQAGPHVALGHALIQAIQETRDGELAGELAARADAAFDAALRIDPGHWGARFTKASSLTYWPESAGRRAEAIEHFELLVRQQANLAAEPAHAETHALLGRMYLATGRPDAARAAWEQGLASFPAHPGLLELLQSQGWRP